jgi:hypothetical protein
MARLKFLGWGVRRIAPDLGCSHRTARPYLAAGGWVLYQAPERSAMLDGLHGWPAETPLNLELMRVIDAQFLETPWYSSRQMARHLRREGYTIGRKRIGRLMAKMGSAPIHQRPRTSPPHPEHRVFLSLVRELVIDRPNQVWCADIAYLPMRHGFIYPVAVIGWATRKVLAFWVSNTMEVEFRPEALEAVLVVRLPRDLRYLTSANAICCSSACCWRATPRHSRANWSLSP